MKEEWLMPGAIVPVDIDTTKALVGEIKCLIGVVGEMALQQAEKRQWVAMSDERIKRIFYNHGQFVSGKEIALVRCIEAMLKENKHG